MAYKRALWHSGLTYQQACGYCKAIVRYTDESLDFRPWFADGFVYCPRCKQPMRHNECYAIDANGNYITPQQPQAPAAQPATQPNAAFCTNCGKQLGAGDNFCSACGTKRQ